MKKILALAAIVAALTACGDKSPDTFNVKGSFGGTVTNNADIKPGKSCTYMDGTVLVGEALVLKGASGQILGKANLTAGSMRPIVCMLDFEFKNVPAGESGYTLELESGTYPAVTATEQDLRAASANISVRSALEVMTSGGVGQVKIKMAPYN